MTPVCTPALQFLLPPAHEARVPPESRGLERDQVRLMVVRPSSLSHGEFRDLSRHLARGDLVVVNTSGTLPAALDGRWRQRPIVVHLSMPLDVDGRSADAREWVIELRHPDGRAPVLDAWPGEQVRLAGNASVTLLRPETRRCDGVRLWVAQITTPGPLRTHLRAHGRPITYGHLDGAYPLAAYQTVFARHPGSAEMASAGRPFTTAVLADLAARGVRIAPITLHAGVSSLEAHEPPRPERYHVPGITARMVGATKAAGGRVVAVGTTVTRALETVATGDGIRPGAGWTDLVLGPDRPARIVDGLLTGWHEPGASHLQLLQAVAPRGLVARAYEAALAGPYLWHEFGDSCLLLP